MAIPVALFLAALLVRVLTAAVFGHPGYPDSFYYVNVAHQLAAGNGFSIDYVWNFVDVGGRLPAEAALPIPSNAHWMPLAALVQVPFLLVFGPGVVAQGLPFWIAGAVAAPLTYAIGRDAGLSRGVATAGGALVAVPGGVAPFLSQPDNFALFMPLAALALWACARGLAGDRRAFALGGLVVGLATLSRNDGVLLGIPFAFGFLLDRLRVWRGSSGATGPRRASIRDRIFSGGRISWASAIACGALFLISIAPWYLRQLAVFGSLSPSAENGRILWIRDYASLFSISSETTLSTFLAQGPGPLLASRVSGLLEAMKVFAVTPLMIFLTPLLLIGLWQVRRRPAFAPWIAYGTALFAFNALLFAVHVPWGTFLHSAVGLVPHAYLAVVVGIGAVVKWIARRRPHWDPPRATRNFTAMIVVVAAVFTAAAAWRIGAGTWGGEQQMRAPIVAALANAPAGDRLMSPDPGAYRYLAGRSGIITPNDPLPVVESALRAYEVRWLVLERDTVLPSLEPLLRGTDQPAWLSKPLVTVPAPARPGEAADAAAARLPLAALYAVCLDAGDTRCSE